MTALSPDRIIRAADFLLMIIASVALFALMVMTFLDVTMRSVFNASIQEATELTRIFMAVLVFASLPVLMARGGAISIDLLDPLFRRIGIERGLAALVSLFTGLILFWPVQRLWVLVVRTRSYGEVTEYLHIPQYLVLGFIAVAVAVTGLAAMARGVFLLLRPRAGRAAR